MFFEITTFNFQKTFLQYFVNYVRTKYKINKNKNFMTKKTKKKLLLLFIFFLILFQQNLLNIARNTT